MRRRYAETVCRGEQSGYVSPESRFEVRKTDLFSIAQTRLHSGGADCAMACRKPDLAMVGLKGVVVNVNIIGITFPIANLQHSHLCGWAHCRFRIQTASIADPASMTGR